MNKEEIKKLIQISLKKEIAFEKTVKTDQLDEELFEEIVVLIKKILKYFGLPYSDRFLEVYYNYTPLKTVTDKDVDKAYNRLVRAAEKFLTLPVMPDEQRLKVAVENNESTYDVLPELKIKDFQYFVFLYEELLLSKLIESYEFLDEVNKVKKYNLYDDIDTLYHGNPDTHIYRKLKHEYKLAFVDKYLMIN